MLIIIIVLYLLEEEGERLEIVKNNYAFILIHILHAFFFIVTFLFLKRVHFNPVYPHSF